MFRGNSKLKIFFFALILLIVLLLLVSVPRLSIPLLSAYVIFLILRPIFPLLYKTGCTHRVATYLIFSAFLLITVIPVVIAYPKFQGQINHIGDYIPIINAFIIKKFHQVQAAIQSHTGYNLDERVLSEMLASLSQSSKEVLYDIPLILGSVLEWSILVPIIVFFMLRDYRSFKRKLLSIVPNTVIERFYSVIHEFNKNLGNYIFAKFIEATFMGLLVSGGLFLIDVKFYLLFGILAALTNVIPYIGPILGALPPLIFIGAEVGVSGQFWMVSILMISANIVDMMIVFPLLVSKVVDLHPVVVILSVIVGSQLLGLLGMIICIPMAVAVKLVYIECLREVYGITAER